MTAPAPSPPVPSGRKTRLERLKLWQIDALGVAACAALAALWYFAGLEPLQQARAARAGMETELQDRSQEADQLRAELGSLERLSAERHTLLSRSELHLSPPDQVNDRVASLTSLVREDGLRLDEIKPGAPVGQARHTAVPIHVSGAGEYSRCGAFLHHLRERFPDVGLTAMDLKGEPEAPDRTPRFTFDLVWYAAPAAPGTRK